MLSAIGYSLGALAGCAFLIALLRGPAMHIGLVDVPGGRKEHRGHVPLVGGIALFGAFVFVTMLLDRDLGMYRGLFWGMGVLLIAGVLDDLQELRPAAKFTAQLLAAVVLVVWGDHRIGHLGLGPGGDPMALGWLAAPFTVLCTVGLINAVNMLDGVDGLAGGVVLVMLGWLVAVALLADSATDLAVPLILMGSVVGFLVFNFPHPWRSSAAVFLGDSGSMLLGLAVAWFAIDIAEASQAYLAPSAVAWILALPVIDTLSLMARRLRKGRHPMAPDREHLHHIFQRAGFTLRGTVYLLLGIAFTLGAIGVGAWLAGIPDWIMLLALVVLFGGHLYFVQHAWRMVRAIRWMRGRAKRASRRGNR